jgi:hypothetical protein
MFTNIPFKVTPVINFNPQTYNMQRLLLETDICENELEDLICTGKFVLLNKIFYLSY